MSSLELLLLLAGKEEGKGESAGGGGAAAGEPRVHPRPVVRGQGSNREGRVVRSLAFSGVYQAPRLRREGLSGATMRNHLLSLQLLLTSSDTVFYFLTSLHLRAR